MSFVNDIFELIRPYIPLLLTATGFSLLLWGAHVVLIARNKHLGNERMLSRHLVMLALTIVSILALAIALPVSDSTRNQIIGLIGLGISGIFAFSSTTIFANIMSGVMLRVTRPFVSGSFVSVGDHFGRVVERGLLDTEIQTEDRQLVALPNTYMIAHPVSVVRSSGTIVSVTLSLGYDVHHARIETLLIEAAGKAGLEEPFVQILELGDFAVTYKACGMLVDVKRLLSARSDLCRSVLDTLHAQGIEIASPALMNQRRFDGVKIVPKQHGSASIDPVSTAEDIVFDKAEQAAQIEEEKLQLKETLLQLEKDLEVVPEEDKKQIKDQIKATRKLLASMKKAPMTSIQDETLSTLNADRNSLDKKQESSGE